MQSKPPAAVVEKTTYPLSWAGGAGYFLFIIVGRRKIYIVFKEFSKNMKEVKKVMVAVLG